MKPDIRESPVIKNERTVKKFAGKNLGLKRFIEDKERGEMKRKIVEQMKQKKKK